MITKEFAARFAQEWVDAWNSHDLDIIMSHYTDDFSIETPMAAMLVPESKGLVEGKEAVRAYWTIGLQCIPNLHFEILDVHTGINGVAIYYRNTSTGRVSTEVMFFNDKAKVNRVVVFYGN
jgi:ketosteroid isomerase-like protein